MPEFEPPQGNANIQTGTTAVTAPVGSLERFLHTQQVATERLIPVINSTLANLEAATNPHSPQAKRRLNQRIFMEIREALINQIKYRNSVLFHLQELAKILRAQYEALLREMHEDESFKRIQNFLEGIEKKNFLPELDALLKEMTDLEDQLIKLQGEIDQDYVNLENAIQEVLEKAIDSENPEITIPELDNLKIDRKKFIFNVGHEMKNELIAEEFQENHSMEKMRSIYHNAYLNEIEKLVPNNLKELGNFTREKYLPQHRIKEEENILNLLGNIFQNFSVKSHSHKNQFLNIQGSLAEVQKVLQSKLATLPISRKIHDFRESATIKNDNSLVQQLSARSKIFINPRRNLSSQVSKAEGINDHTIPKNIEKSQENNKEKEGEEVNDNNPPPSPPHFRRR